MASLACAASIDLELALGVVKHPGDFWVTAPCEVPLRTLTGALITLRKIARTIRGFHFLGRVPRRDPKPIC